MKNPLQVTLPSRPRLRISPRAFEALCAANRDLRLTRTARGELIIMAPAGSDSSNRNAGLTSRLWVWNQAAGLGVCFESSGGFRFPNGLMHAPDATWITRERWDRLTREQQERFAPICPDFVVELCSPSDKRTEVRDRMREYRDLGVRLGWMLDPKTGTAEIYQPDRPVEVLAHPPTLSGGDVLPGFVLDLKGILFD